MFEQVATTVIAPPPGAAPLVDIVVPVYNEERDLEASVRLLRAFLDASFPWRAQITVVDNGSTDATAQIADRLSRQVPGVRSLTLETKGRGRALRTAWSSTQAPVVAYTDVDLSTSLDALLPLVAPLVSGHSDLAIGSRLAPGARVWRGPKRELISRGYNFLLRLCLHNRFSDAQCGFKAMRTEVAQRLLPDVEDDGWFFDTELLVAAEREGLRIHEVPVDWVDDPDSRVDIVATAKADLKGVWRLLRRRNTAAAVHTRQAELAAAAASFARVGVVSTAAYLLLFFAMRPVCGALIANAAALALCTVGNTTANRLLTFPGPVLTWRRLAAAGIAAFATSLAATTPVVAAVGPFADSSPWLVVVALVAANAAAALFRFAVLRAWLFRTRPFHHSEA